MINLTQLLAEQLKTPKDVVVIGKFGFDIIALNDDSKELVENAGDVFIAHKMASIYGLRSGLKPLVELDGASVEIVNSIYENSELPNDVVVTVAKAVIELSGLDYDELVEEKSKVDLIDDQEDEPNERIA